MAAISITLDLDEDLVRRAEKASNGNLTEMVSRALIVQLEGERRQKLREDLIAGCIEDAELDLEICRDWAHIDAVSN